MQSVLVFNYNATGEGSETRIFFSGSMTDEAAVELLKSRLDPYFHVSLKLIALEAIDFDKHWSKMIEIHTPLLHKYLSGDQGYHLVVDYRSLVNYS